MTSPSLPVSSHSRSSDIILINSSIRSLGTLIAGSNNIAINVISGSSGDDFLSPNFVFDSIELF